MGRRSPPKLEMLVPGVTEAESWISDATWALTSMARSRVRGRGKKMNIFGRGDRNDEGKGKGRDGHEALAERQAA